YSSVDGEIEDLGLTFQIATRMTSWVAIDESRLVRGSVREQLIPQELPYGTKASSFGLRSAPPSDARLQAQLFGSIFESGESASFDDVGEYDEEALRGGFDLEE